MADEEVSINAFFARHGLNARTRLACHEYLSEQFPGKPITPAHTQGYCSYTVLVDSSLVVQFRPKQYALDIKVAAAAKIVYGSYAPSTEFLGTLEPAGLLVYVMEKMGGVSYKDFTDRAIADPPAQAAEMRLKLCEDFALFLAHAWRHREKDSLPLGRIGSSIPARLEKLSTELPYRFRPTATLILSKLNLINTLPKVLAHGDIVPSNIMMAPPTGHLIGLVDWAEAEPLPFGICLYGLEEILGRIAHDRFIYHAGAAQARHAFWKKLRKEIPELEDAPVVHAVRLARVLGVLLWHGFAFDDGRIDRVVQEDRDHLEIVYLDAFLGRPQAML